MKRVVLCLALCLSAAIAGCASGGAPAARHMGAVNNGLTIPCETLTLGNATVSTAARLTISIDTLAIHVVTTGTATGTWTLNASSDGSSFTAVTLPSPPPAASGSAQDFWIVYDWWEPPYEQVTFTGTGGSGSATVCMTMKG